MVMEDMEFHVERETQELIRAFERELDAARHLNREVRDAIRETRKRDYQLTIERRRKPR
jgi:hypothetical protein